MGRPAAADWLLRKLTCYAMRWTNADNTGQKWTGRDIGHAGAEFWENAKMAQLTPRTKDKLTQAPDAWKPTSRGVRSAVSPAFPRNRLVTEHNCLDSGGQNWTRVDVSGSCQ